jgi:hypothetical protein
VHGNRVAWVHGCMVTGVHGARMQGCMVLGPWVHGCRVYIHGSTEPWEHGALGQREYGAMGTRNQGEGGAWGTFEPERNRGTHPTNPKFRFFDYPNGLW